MTTEKTVRITNRDVYERLCKIEAEMAHRRDLISTDKVEAITTNITMLSQSVAEMTADVKEMKKHINDWHVARAVLKWLAWLGGSIAVLLAGAWLRNLFGGK